MNTPKNYMEFRLDNTTVRIEEDCGEEDEKWVEDGFYNTGNIGIQVGSILDALGVPNKELILAHALMTDEIVSDEGGDEIIEAARISLLESAQKFIKICNSIQGNFNNEAKKFLKKEKNKKNKDEDSND